MKKMSIIGGAFALAACIGCATQCGAQGPNFQNVKWERDAFDSGVWTIDDAGVMTASKDRAIWSTVDYENFILDFDYKLEAAANSGVLIYVIDKDNWIPGSIEIQLLDDNHERWRKDAPHLKNSSLYGHLAPLATPGKPAGEWNHMTVTAKGQSIKVELNGVKTIDADISAWKDAKKNPNGTRIPPWLSTPWATIPTTGRIGFQGMHGGAKPFFRNVRVAAIPDLKPYTDGATARTAEYRRQRDLAEKLAKEPTLTVDLESVRGNAAGYIDSEAPEMAFNPGTGKKLCCNWIGKLTLSAALTKQSTVSHYTLASANDYAGRDPKTWNLYVSDDGKNWQLVDSRKDVKFTSRNQLQNFELAKPVTATQFKLEVLANHGEKMIQFSRLTFRK